MAKTSMCIIGCKLPAGLSFEHEGKKIVLNGSNSSQLINGFGLTRDVPSDAWAYFESRFKGQPMLVNGLVFAVADDKSADSASKERSKQKTGMEQANPKSAGVEVLAEE